VKVVDDERGKSAEEDDVKMQWLVDRCNYAQLSMI